MTPTVLVETTHGATPLLKATSFQGLPEGADEEVEGFAQLLNLAQQQVAVVPEEEPIPSSSRPVEPQPAETDHSSEMWFTTLNGSAPALPIHLIQQADRVEQGQTSSQLSETSVSRAAAASPPSLQLQEARITLQSMPEEAVSSPASASLIGERRDIPSGNISPLPPLNAPETPQPQTHVATTPAQQMSNATQPRRAATVPSTQAPSQRWGEAFSTPEAATRVVNDAAPSTHAVWQESEELPMRQDGAQPPGQSPSPPQEATPQPIQRGKPAARVDDASRLEERFANQPLPNVQPVRRGEPQGVNPVVEPEPVLLAPKQQVSEQRLSPVDSPQQPKVARQPDSTPISSQQVWQAQGVSQQTFVPPSGQAFATARVDSERRFSTHPVGEEPFALPEVTVLRVEYDAPAPLDGVNPQAATMPSAGRPLTAQPVGATSTERGEPYVRWQVGERPLSPHSSSPLHVEPAAAIEQGGVRFQPLQQQAIAWHNPPLQPSLQETTHSLYSSAGEQPAQQRASAEHVARYDNAPGSAEAVVAQQDTPEQQPLTVSHTPVVSQWARLQQVEATVAEEVSLPLEEGSMVATPRRTAPTSLTAVGEHEEIVERGTQRAKTSLPKEDVLPSPPRTAQAEPNLSERASTVAPRGVEASEPLVAPRQASSTEQLTMPPLAEVATKPSAHGEEVRQHLVTETPAAKPTPQETIAAPTPNAVTVTGDAPQAKGVEGSRQGSSSPASEKRVEGAQASMAEPPLEQKPKRRPEVKERTAAPANLEVEASHSAQRLASTGAERIATAPSPQQETRPVDHPPLVRQIAQQVEEMVTSRVRSVTLQLHPEDLGRLRITVSLREGSIHTHIVAESPVVRQIMENSLSQLQQALQQRGLQLGALQVSVQGEGRHLPPQYQPYHAGAQTWWAPSNLLNATEQFWHEPAATLGRVNLLA